ncbi:MAG: DUF3108 domain-containing protein [Hyphomicrobiales bacterium]
MLFASTGQSFAADNVRVFTKYGISIAGIPIGNARVNTTFNGKRFKISANGRTAGVSRLVSDGRGTLRAEGVIGKNRAFASNFSMDTVDDKLVTKVRMSMSKGNIKRLLAAPPLSKRPDRIPVLKKHHRSILDPLSAFMVPLDGDGKIEPAKACNRTIPVFDGWQRFNVRLSFSTTKNAKLGGRDGYNGPVVVCKARYVPIAGHRPTRKTTVYLANNKNMELWLAPVEGVPTLVPVHVRIGTKVGSLTLSASIFQVSGTKTASSQ